MQQKSRERTCMEFLETGCFQSQIFHISNGKHVNCDRRHHNKKAEGGGKNGEFTVNTDSSDMHGILFLWNMFVLDVKHMF